MSKPNTFVVPQGVILDPMFFVTVVNQSRPVSVGVLFSTGNIRSVVLWQVDIEPVKCMADIDTPPLDNKETVNILLQTRITWMAILRCIVSLTIEIKSMGVNVMTRQRCD